MFVCAHSVCTCAGIHDCACVCGGQRWKSNVFPLLVALFSFLKKNKYFYFMCVSVYLHVCMYIAYRAQESQKKSLNLLELELQVIVSHYMGAGTESGSSAGTTSIFNC